MTSAASPAPPGPRITRVQILVCVIAAVGFLFDNYELTLVPLTIRAALLELTGNAPGSVEYGTWAGRMFFLPACAGGICGLLGGYLIDRLGRRRVLTWSIFLYATSAFASGLCTSIGPFLILRCVTVSSVFVEYVAAVAWLAEIFSDPRQAARAIAYAQVFSSLGGLLAAVVNGALAQRAPLLPAIQLPAALQGAFGAIAEPHATWRYMYLSGLLPALPLLFVRPFLPESPRWEAARREGTLQRPSYRELFSPTLRRATLTSTVLCACMVGMAYGGLWQIAQTVPRLVEGDARIAALLPDERARAIQVLAAGYVATYEIGGIAGRFLLAFLIGRVLDRKRLYRILHLPATLLVPLAMLGIGFMNNRTLLTLGSFSLTELHLLIFVASMFLISQVSFWGTVLPGMFPLHLRGSGESLAFNAGGRMLGAACALLTSNLAVTRLALGGSPPSKLAFASAAVAFALGLLSLTVSRWLPTPADHEGVPSPK